jgi:hypothetical protein
MKKYVLLTVVVALVVTISATYANNIKSKLQ